MIIKTPVMYKLAKVITELQPHQQRVVDKIKKDSQPGLVVAHGLGSGKTLTSIAAQEALNLPADVIVPAALQENYKKEVKKHTKGRGPERDIQSMQNVAVKYKIPKKPMMIVDEAHRLRDRNSRTFKAVNRSQADKRLLLTGSPFYNHPADLAPLIDVAAGKPILPTNKEDFARQYVTEEEVNPGFWARLKGVKPGIIEKVNPKTRDKLQKIYKKWVDYHPSSSEHYPTVTREDVKVPMTSKQMDMYDSMIGEAPAWVSWKIRNNLPPSKQEAKQLNAYMAAVRQISNSTAPYQSSGTPEEPKIQAAFENLKKQLDGNPRAKAVIYSNFLDAGINPYKRRLDEAKIPYGEFTGEMPRNERDELVRRYNEGKIRTLLLSSAGGEGLDLKGTRLMQLLDPHWNFEKLKQVEGRGVRFKSHEHLPEEERKVLVQRYLATRAPKGVLEKLKLKKPGTAADEYLTTMSENKEKLINDFRSLLSQQAIQEKANA